MQIILMDFRCAWRRALRQPWVTLSIILLLAIGIGGVTAVFNPTYSVLFSPLPFPKPEQLMRISGTPGLLIDSTTNSFTDEEALGRIFSNKAAYYTKQSQIRIADTGKTLDVNTLVVTGEFFETLGVKLFMGPGFSGKGNNIEYIVSHRFWRNELMQKSDAIGSHVFALDGNLFGASDEKLFPIVGIMPENFNFPFDIDIWQPVVTVSEYPNMPDATYIGRLRPEISVGKAAEELKNIVDRNKNPSQEPNAKPLGARVFSQQASKSADRTPAKPEGSEIGYQHQFQLESLQIYLYGDQRPMLKMLGAAAILFLVLVCAGVVNILVAQGAKRKHEIAMRLIFGAKRRNLVFQLVRETLPLVVIGGLTGLWLSEIVSMWMWAQMPALRGGVVNVPAKIAFWTSLVVVVTIIGGMIPSLFATGLDLNTYLKSASAGKRRFFSMQEFLVGVQLSLALALLIGVGVLIRSLMFNVDIPVGWSSRDIAVVSVIHDQSPSASRRSININQDVQRELNAMPEVVVSGVVSPIPFSADAVKRGGGIGRSYILKDLQKRRDMMVVQAGIIPSSDATVVKVDVSPDGFKALGIPIVLGRHFTDADAENRRKYIGGELPTPVIINQVLAEHLWPEENPIGKMFVDNQVSYREVVGVVRNYHGIPNSRNFIPAMYFPYTETEQRPTFLVKLRPGTSFQDFHSDARRRLSGLGLIWIEAKPLSEYVKDATVNQRLTLQLLTWFAVLGIIVSGLGVYATATLMASARTKETGIRMALGAQTWDILKLTFCRGIRAILVGLPVGLFLAWVLARILSSFLVQVNIDDPLSWILSCAVLLVIATVAALIPALRATRVNPLDAMRQ